MFCCFGCFARANSRFWATDDAAAGPAVPAAAGHAAAIAALGGERWIDIHCHLFNILDLPALEFIDRTRLTMPWPLKIGPLLLLIPMIGGLNKMAMTAEAELVQLQAGMGGRLMAGNPPHPQLDTVTALKVIDGRQSLGGGASPLTAPLMASLLPDLGVTHQRPAPPRRGTEMVRDAVNRLIPRRDLGAPATDGEIELLAQHIDALLTAPNVLSPDANKLAVAPVIAGLGTDLESAGVFLDWAEEMTQPRNKLTGKLLAQFPAAADVLVTPALVDYSRWLGIGQGAFDPISNLDTQIDVMAEIAKSRARDTATTRKSGLFCFAPFDPWRMLEDRQHGRSTMLDRIKQWVARGDVIGIKLYPPMGFRPVGNAKRAIGEFPGDLTRLVGGHPGAALDVTLDDVFTWCEAQGVAVMAHCGDSNESQTNYGLLAGPDGWSEVLAKHNDLHLNLGHFGGVFGFGSSDVRVKSLARSWAETIALLMATHPNLYADLGFSSQLLAAVCEPDQECGITLSYLEDLTARHPVVRERIMYGSDWVMVGMVDGSDQYAARIRAVLTNVFPGDLMEDFRWRNAARFLGLRQGDKARARMASFIDQVAPGLLARFDPG